MIGGFPTEDKVVFFGKRMAVMVNVDHIINSNKTGADFGAGYKIVSVGFFQVIVIFALFDFSEFCFVYSKKNAVTERAEIFFKVKDVGGRLIFNFKIKDTLEALDDSGSEGTVGDGFGKRVVAQERAVAEDIVFHSPGYMLYFSISTSGRTAGVGK